MQHDQAFHAIDDWRGHFLQIRQGMLGTAGPHEPDVEDDGMSAAEFSVDINGVAFTAMHFGSDGVQPHPAHCLVHGHIGRVQLPRDASALRTALVVNQGLARTHSGQIALDATRALLVYSVFQPLPGLHATDLTHALAQMADVIQTLRTALDLQPT